MAKSRWGRMGSRTSRRRSAAGQRGPRLCGPQLCGPQLGLESLEPRRLLAVEPLLITEFMASNDTTLVDGDGNSSDWIELYNPNEQPLSLGGWHLTDDPGNLDKWPLPEIDLGSKAYLVVFASGQNGNNYIDAEGYFHTDFRLSGGGEYLGLAYDEAGVGLAVIQEFAPSFPPQLTDISYGLPNLATTSELVTTGAATSWQVPTDASLGSDWTALEFDDSTWNDGLTGLGYDTGGAEAADYAGAVLTAQPVGYWRFAESSGITLANGGTLGSAADAISVGGAALGALGPRPPAFIGFEADNTAVGFDGLNDAVTTGAPLLNGLTEFTLAGWIRPGGITSNRVGLWGQNDLIEFGFISPTTLQVWTDVTNSGLDAAYPFAANEWHHVAVVGDGATLRIYLDGVQAASRSNSTSNYGSSSFNFNIGGGGIFDTTGNHFTGEIDEVAAFHRALSAAELQNLFDASTLSGSSSQVDFTPEIATDVTGVMQDVNSSIYARTEFEVTNTENVDQLLLRMKYDDGFVAYLNGQEVARSNAPATPAWDSVAVALRADQQAVEFETIDITADKSFLQLGTNVLAIQGLNESATGPDFLMVPELDALETRIEVDTPRYFRDPTPGAANSTGVDDVGPIISQVTELTTQPDDGDEILITAQVDEAFSPVANVNLVYRVMFQMESTVPMVDDGSGSDAIAGDGLFSAVIPAAAADPGEMLRWYVTAEDTSSNLSRFPFFAITTGVRQSPEYFGTVVAEPSLTSTLPIFQWFVQDPAAAQTRTGTRASVFHLGEFYDNVFVRQRGGSTQSTPKKSFKFEFNDGHHFVWEAGQGLVDELNLNTTISNKDYVRQTLAFDVYDLLGAPGSESRMWRVEQNGEFFSIAPFIEQPDKDLLGREDLDNDGALYKMYNSFTSGTSGVEKKNRQEEGNSDLVSFVSNVNNLSGTALHNYLFDTVDIPAVLNYMAATVLVHQNDNPHKNHYLYRDSDGSGEWLFLPWDNDLTFGKNWVGTSFSDQMYANNDSVSGKPSNIRPSHPFINTGDYREWNNNWNRLMDALIDDPTFQEMYLRRLRSGMDLVFGDANLSGTTRWYDQRVLELFQNVQDDAVLDYEKWNDPWIWGADQSLEQAVSVLLGYQVDATGNPVLVGGNPVEIADGYANRRRDHLYVNHAEGSVGQLDFLGNPIDVAGIPSAQAGIVSEIVTFGALDFNPDSGDQDQEYIQLTNNSGEALDISGWTLTGGISHTFKPGTVIPAGASLYVTPESAAFRARSTGPSGGQGLFVQAWDRGHLSNFGETIQLLAADGTPIDTLSYVGNPSPEQRYLRISELNYHPYDALTQFGDADVDNGLFEFLEFTNTSPTETLNLTGVGFSRGIEFQFGTSEADSLLDVNFNAGPAGFAYQDDVFNGSVNPTFASGAFELTSGPAGDGALEVFLAASTSFGNRGPASGGWSTQFTAVEPQTVTVALDFRMVMEPGLDSDEFGEAILEINGTRLGNASNGSLLHLSGNDPVDSNWLSESFQMELSAGTHTLTVGGYNNKSTRFNESVEFFFDNIHVEGTTVGPPIPLLPGERVVVVRDQAAFESRYGTGVNLGGEFREGALSNGGETLKLDDANGSTILEFTYGDGGDWPGRADGKGATLEPIDLGPGIAASLLFDDPTNWQSSNEFHGSPGAAGSGPVYDLIVNEILSQSSAAASDQIELFNTTAGPLALDGWHLSDTSTDYLRYTFPAGVTLEGGEYLVLDQSEFGFELDGQLGDDVWFIQGDPVSGKPLRFADHQDFDAMELNRSLGVWPQGAPGGTLVPMAFPTFGQANNGPVYGDLLITEIHYAPGPVPPSYQASISQNELEFVELFNNRERAWNISNWQIEGIEWTFPTGTSLAAGEAIVIVTFDPQLEPSKAAAFREIFGVAEAVQLFGDADGRLDNAGDRVTLLKPENGATLATGNVLLDAVQYDVVAPWPTTANGTGSSLTRTARTAFAPQDASWIAATASPGSVAYGGLAPGDYDRNGVVDAVDEGIWRSTFGSHATAASNGNLPIADGNLNGIVDSADFTLWRDHLGESVPPLTAPNVSLVSGNLVSPSVSGPVPNFRPLARAASPTHVPRNSEAVLSPSVRQAGTQSLREAIAAKRHAGDTFGPLRQHDRLSFAAIDLAHASLELHWTVDGRDYLQKLRKH